MNDTTSSYPSMSQSPPAAASHNDGSDNSETLDYGDMGTPMQPSSRRKTSTSPPGRPKTARP